MKWFNHGDTGEKLGKSQRKKKPIELTGSVSLVNFVVKAHGSIPPQKREQNKRSCNYNYINCQQHANIAIGQAALQTVHSAFT